MSNELKLEDVKALLDEKTAQSPTGTPFLGQVGTKVALILAIVVGGVLALPSAGISLPPAVLAAASLLSTALTALGIASPGLRKAP
jgi:hypothetical protein